MARNPFVSGFGEEVLHESEGTITRETYHKRREEGFSCSQAATDDGSRFEDSDEEADETHVGSSSNPTSRAS